MENDSLIPVGAFDKRLLNLSLQEIFNESKEHLLKQNAKSMMNGDSACAYRGDDGMKCAAGIFIRDVDYHKGLEGRAWYNNMLSEGLGDEKRKLIIRLQKIHDNECVEDWKGELNRLERSIQ